MTVQQAHFSDPKAVARYADGPPRYVPGFHHLHRMSAILLAEHAPQNARILILGAGGGLELNALAKAHAGWTFDGVDPSPEMLKLAEQTIGPYAARARLHRGYIDDAPLGPFDGAACLLTLHFLPIEERLRTAMEIRRRLRPGAAFVAAHSSFPQGQDERKLWLARYESFAVASGADPGQASHARGSVDAHLNILTPEQDAALLREAGFSGVSLFYAAFTWRGWVAYA